MARAIRVEIHGIDMPGRTCGPRPDGGTYEDIHVGLKRRNDTIDLVPGDAADARWAVDVTVRDVGDGHDFGGPFVSGDRSDRHLGLRWLGRERDGSLELFRGAKIRLVDVDPGLVDQALDLDRTLVATVDLTDEHGWPRCARVRPPAIRWTVAQA
jgi:Family of unknown function (DUF5990)